MSKPKLTDWFPYDVKPSLPGMYERDWDGYYVGAQRHDFFDGEAWHFGNEHGEYNKSTSTYPLSWRGLASDPSKKPA
jgi:hypothetical protein